MKKVVSVLTVFLYGSTVSLGKNGSLTSQFNKYLFLEQPSHLHSCACFFLTLDFISYAHTSVCGVMASLTGEMIHIKNEMAKLCGSFYQ